MLCAPGGLRVCSCFPANTPHPEGHTQTFTRASRSCASGSSLAEEAMVRRPPEFVSVTSLEDTLQRGLSQPRGSDAPGPSMASVDHLEIERYALRQNHLPTSVIQTIQASWRPSMDCIYSATWRAFCKWCDLNRVSALQASIIQVLMFLQDSFD